MSGAEAKFAFSYASRGAIAEIGLCRLVTHTAPPPLAVNKSAAVGEVKGNDSMPQVLFNNLAYARRLEEAGFSQQQVLAAADALAEALCEAVATKSDIALLEGRFSKLEWMATTSITLSIATLGTLWALALHFLR